MITYSVFKEITTSLMEAKAFATLHRFALVLAAEIAGTLCLLWGVVYRPRTCIMVALAAYLLNRHGPKLFGPAKVDTAS